MDLNIPRKALVGRQHEIFMYPRDIPSMPRIGDGEQEPLHKSWNPQQPGQEDVDRMNAESLADEGMPDADAKYPDTSSYWTEPTDLEYLSNLRLEDWINPELLDALAAALASPVPKTEILETEHGFLYSYHKGHSKPYVCEVEGCDLEDRSFGTKSALKKHQKNHVAKQNMPWACPKCPKRFALPHYLARHLATKHSDARPFPCDECDKSFKRRDGLKVHKKRLHSSTASSSGGPKTPKTPSTAPKRRHASKSIVSSSSSHLQGLSSRMDGIEIASCSSCPFPPTPTPRPYY
jgi:KRAB domain-containing zinc finger protein